MAAWLASIVERNNTSVNVVQDEEEVEEDHGQMEDERTRGKEEPPAAERDVTLNGTVVAPTRPAKSSDLSSKQVSFSQPSVPPFDPDSFVKAKTPTMVTSSGTPVPEEKKKENPSPLSAFTALTPPPLGSKTSALVASILKSQSQPPKPPTGPQPVVIPSAFVPAPPSPIRPPIVAPSNEDDSGSRLDGGEDSGSRSSSKTKKQSTISSFSSKSSKKKKKKKGSKKSKEAVQTGAVWPGWATADEGQSKTAARVERAQFTGAAALFKAVTWKVIL
jgi:hypothetical protein